MTKKEVKYKNKTKTIKFIEKNKKTIELLLFIIIFV